MTQKSPLSPKEMSPREVWKRQLWRWFIAPSARIEEPDQRRQAALLSAFILGIIVLAFLVETFTVLTIDWENYTGYRQTIGAVLALSVIYIISRTRRVQLAAILAVIATTLAVLVTGLFAPRSVLGGILDFMILPLWLGSLYLNKKQLAVLIAVQLIALLIFPFLTPEISMLDILVGPFSFLFATSIILVIVTNHRNKLEADRRALLEKKDKFNQREAARAKALLRVAERLNAQLDLDALLNVIADEVAEALGTPVSAVPLYDVQHDTMPIVAVSGMQRALVDNYPALPRATFDALVENMGTSFALKEMPPELIAGNEAALNELGFQSLAFTTMSYEGELIGGLAAIEVDQHREFTEEELLLLRGIADQAALAIINTRLYKDARRRLENLQALRAIDIAIASNQDLHKTLDVVLEQITRQLGVDAGVILILNESRQQLEYAASRGFISSTLRYTRLAIGQGMAGRAAQQRQIISIGDLKNDPQTLTYSSGLTNEGFASYCAAPLIIQGEVKGVIEVFHRSRLDANQEWLDFLETLAGQAAIAIANTSLFADLQKTNSELFQAYDSTIEGWSHALDLRDKETEGHTLRVTELTVQLARAFDFSEAQLVHIRRGALLHDIGKMGIPDRILLKKGPLSEAEWEIMRQHPVYAHEMLRSIEYLRPALDIPYYHHEKWDGTGYPHGLKGQEIPFCARIFAVVDVWDALTSQRPYREAWSEQRVLEYIREQSGSHFEPQVVDKFLEIVGEKMAIVQD